MKFKEDVAYIVTTETIITFITDAAKAGLLIRDDIREIKHDFRRYLFSLDYVILYIQDGHVWYDISLSEKFTIDKLTPEVLAQHSNFTRKVIYRKKVNMKRKIEKNVAYFVTSDTLDDFINDLGPMRPPSNHPANIAEIRDYLEDDDVNHIVFYGIDDDLLFDTRFEDKQYEQVTLKMLNTAGFNVKAKEYYVPEQKLGVHIDVRASGVKVKVNPNLLYF